jgi:hypothetical protein
MNSHDTGISQPSATGISVRVVVLRKTQIYWLSFIPMKLHHAGRTARPQKPLSATWYRACLGEAGRKRRRRLQSQLGQRLGGCTLDAIALIPGSSGVPIGRTRVRDCERSFVCAGRWNGQCWACEFGFNRKLDQVANSHCRTRSRYAERHTEVRPFE